MRNYGERDNDENLDGLRIELAEEPYHSQTQIILMEDWINLRIQSYTEYKLLHSSSEETLGPKALCY